MERVTSILENKKPSFQYIVADTPLDKALQKMQCEGVDYLIVMQDDNYLGLISDHGIATNILLCKGALQNFTAKDVMDTKLPMISTDDTVEKCMQTMRRHKTRFVPVFHGFHFKGIISSDDIIHELVAHRMEVFDDYSEENY